MISKMNIDEIEEIENEQEIIYGKYIIQNIQVNILCLLQQKI